MFVQRAGMQTGFSDRYMSYLVPGDGIFSVFGTTPNYSHIFPLFCPFPYALMMNALCWLRLKHACQVPCIAPTICLPFVLHGVVHCIIPSVVSCIALCVVPRGVPLQQCRTTARLGLGLRIGIESRIQNQIRVDQYQGILRPELSDVTGPFAVICKCHGHAIIMSVCGLQVEAVEPLMSRPPPASETIFIIVQALTIKISGSRTLSAHQPHHSHQPYALLLPDPAWGRSALYTLRQHSAGSPASTRYHPPWP